MRVVVVSGLSGSGKSTAIRALEDIGFFSIDNLPVVLLDKLLEILNAAGEGLSQLALVIDARAVLLAPPEEQARGLAQVPKALMTAKTRGHQVDLVFLDSTDEVLVRRFSETRRRHPLSKEGSIQASIRNEREILQPLRDAATRVVETSHLSVHELKGEIQRIVRSDRPLIEITLISFGFKNGLPLEADVVFDVRFLPNPYFDENLKDKTGLEREVSDFVLLRSAARNFLRHTEDLLTFLLPEYQREGKAYLTIAIGCTGGQHRSVAIVEELALRLTRKDWACIVRHRDLGERTVDLREPKALDSSTGDVPRTP